MLKNKKYVCILGPDETYQGGMLKVIHQIMFYCSNQENFDLIHIGTASKKNKVMCFFKGLVKFTVYCLQHKVAIAHIQLSEGASIYRSLVFIIVSKVFRVKIILHSHGGKFYEQYQNYGKVKKNLIKKLFSKTDKVIVLTEGWKNIWDKIVSDDIICVLPNGTKIEKFFEKKYCIDGKLNVLFLGNISDFKGIYELIDAIDILQRKNISINLKIAGGGDIIKCNEYVNRKNLHKYVHLLGWVDEIQKKELLISSDVLALPSHFESFGIAAIEGMACKLPVVCGDRGFTKEVIINEKTGFVAKTGDSQDIANKIELLTKKATLEIMGNNAYNHVKNNYDIKIIMEKLIKIYQELLV